MDEVPDANVESLTRKVLVANFAANFVRVYHCRCAHLAYPPRYSHPPMYV